MKNLTLVLLLALALTACKKETDCPAGYMGDSCTQQITPTSMRITKITVTDFPATDANGAGWDFLDGPDIYVQFLLDNNVLYSHDEYYENANPNLDYSFVPKVNVNIDRPTNRYVIAVFDFDSLDPHDYMGGIEFTPYSDGNRFPPIIDISFGQVSFSIEVTYTF